MPSGIDRSKLWEVFDVVNGLPAAEQEGALARLCGGDERLAEAVRSLLPRPPTSFLEREQRLAPPTPAPPPAEVLESGTLLDGKYALRERIGAGSMGVVYCGEHVKLEKRVAIKLLHASASSSPDVLARMVREAAAVAAVRHENVVAVHDVGLHEGRAYMVMDWIEGLDLHRWLAHARQHGLLGSGREGTSMREFFESTLGVPCSGPLWSRPYWEIVAFVAARIARATASAHASGFVHRDIAPKNILLTAEGRPYLVDFGVAILAGEGGTEHAGIAGTLPYMAPEQLESGPAARRPAVDVYSIGATLYHLIVGRTPFKGAGLELCGAIRRGLPPRIRAHRLDVPRDLEAICFAAMERRPEARYASADALADDLEAFLDRRPVSRRPPNAAGRVLRWCQRRPASALAVGALAAFAVASLYAGGLTLREHARLARDVRAAEFAGLYAKLPALATLNADARYNSAPLPSLEERGLGALWTELVERNPGLPLLRWYRANWNSQQGHLAQVEVDLDGLRHENLGTELFEALAAPLASPESSVRNQLLPPHELPAASTAFDHALKAHVAVRWRDFPTALDAIEQAIQREPRQWMYRDLQAVAGLDAQGSELYDPELYIEDAIRVEEQLGRATCRTLHVRAFLLREVDSDRARELWMQCLELGGDQHQPLHGLGELLYWQGDYLGAVELFERAAQLKSSAWRTHILLSRCSEAEGRFEEAEQALDEGLANLQPGRPEDFRPVRDLALERANLYVVWAGHHTNLAEVESAEARLAQAEQILAPLVEAAHHGAKGLELELRSMQLAIESMLGRRSPSETVHSMRQLHADYLRWTANSAPEALPEASSIIATNLGILLMQSGDDNLLEAEGFLLLGLRDPAVRAEAENALGELSERREAADH